MASAFPSESYDMELQVLGDSQRNSSKPKVQTSLIQRRHRQLLSQQSQDVYPNNRNDGEDTDTDGDTLGPLQSEKRLYENDGRKTPGVRWAAMKQNLKTNVVNFFGVGDDEMMAKWKDRVERAHANSRLLGHGYKPRNIDTPDSAMFTPSINVPVPLSAPAMHHLNIRTPYIRDPLHRGVAGAGGLSHQMSRMSISSSSRRLNRAVMTPQTGRDSVFRMAVDGFKTLVSTPYREKPPMLHARSVTPGQMLKVHEGMTPAVSQMATPVPQSLMQTPMLLPASSAFNLATCSVDSVFQSSNDDYLDDVFYDDPVPTSAVVMSTGDFQTVRHRQQPTAAPDETDWRDDRRHPLSYASEVYYDMPQLPEKGPSKPGWQRGRSQPEPMPGDTPATTFPTPGTFEGLSRISSSYQDDVLEMAGKRQIGRGFVGFFLDAEYRKSRIDTDIRKQMTELYDHRPYFTYWVTFVQIVCYIVSVSVYGFSSIGFSPATIEAEVLKSNLAYEKAHYLEESNMWIGPRQADLIHLGAKYSPCMRRDENVEKALAEDRLAERETACCVRNDRSGCLQSSRSNCSTMLATWMKVNTSLTGRTSGLVCGLDPSYCKNPPNVNDFWPDDITQWPVCRDTVPVNKEHMTCKIQGRPCCIGIQGECIITTREHCTFLRGYFHQDNTLCSQVSCMSEICGMIPFANSSHPDQFYRLFISLFIHVGVLQLAITVVFQVFIMRDLEKLAGTLRITIIYIASGIAGSLSSAIFLPYHVEAGPTGSQFGLLACLFVEVIQNRYILVNPWLAIIRLSAVLLVLFTIGLLPMIDNYAHLVGFFFGFLLAFALLPYITFNVCDRRGKLIGIVASLVAATGLFVGLFALFYIAPLYSCPHCHWFNCLPIRKDFCRSMEVKIGRVAWYS